MSPGTGSRKWVQEKISFTDSSSTDAISQGNAQMYGPNARALRHIKLKAYFQVLDEVILVAPLDSRYTPVGLNREES